MLHGRQYYVLAGCRWLAVCAGAALAGCGTTRSTDTGRTATEQLLISDAIDRAVQTVDFSALRGQTVYLDDSKLSTAVDRDYLVSTLRQHLLASGCALRDDAQAAEFVVEARAGAIGTDRNDLLFGVPSMNVPQFLPGQPTPAAIPEIPLAKRRDQRGIAKISVFAYHRPTGAPVWQSGMAQQESSSNDVWILGAGPFQRGTIYDGTAFAGRNISAIDDSHDEPEAAKTAVAIGDKKMFNPPAKLAGTGTVPPVVAGETPRQMNVPHPIPAIDVPESPTYAAEIDRPPAHEPYARLFPRTPRSATGDQSSQHVASQSDPNDPFAHPRTSRYGEPPFPSADFSSLQPSLR